MASFVMAGGISMGKHVLERVEIYFQLNCLLKDDLNFQRRMTLLGMHVLKA
jgi:hypothetical protein